MGKIGKIVENIGKMGQVVTGRCSEVSDTLCQCINTSYREVVHYDKPRQYLRVFRQADAQ